MPDIEKEIGKKGYITYKYHGKYIYSAYDPFLEAKRYVNNLKNIRKNIITFCGADYINEELVKLTPDLILSYEPIAFEVKNPNTKIKRFSKTDDLEKYLIINEISELSLVFWQPLIESDPDYFLPQLKEIKNIIEKVTYSNIAAKSFNKLEEKNVKRNLRYFNEINILQINEKYIENPAILISSGFSLTENIDFIKQSVPYCYLFVLPSSLPFLNYQDIKPDFVINVDPGFASFYHFTKNKFTANLISPLSINSNIFRLKNIRSFVFNYCSDYENKLLGNIDNIVKSPPEGSVFMNSLRILKQLGFTQVILTGQDFGFKDNRSHINEGFFEVEFLNISGYYNPLEKSIKFLESIKDIDYINDGEKQIKTEKSFKIYYNHFMKNNYDLEINLTTNSFNNLENKFDKISIDDIKNKYKHKDLLTLKTIKINTDKFMEKK